MKAIIIDDEPWMLQHFCEECAGLDEIELVGSYRNPLKAIEFAQTNQIELAFIDMEMPQMNGAEAAKRLLQIWAKIKIIIVTAYDESYVETMHECSDFGYLRKPYKRDELRAAIEKITAT